jgi:signal transduction histidine kinase
MSSIEVNQLLAPAAHTIIIERCQRAYLHDLRGGLQAITGAFELLTRLARSGENDPAVVERAATIAKRALANHESAMLEMVHEIMSEDERAAPTDLGELLEDIVRFLRNDFTGKQIEVILSHPRDLIVRVQKHRLRLILLGLIALRIDDCPGGTPLVIRLDRSDGSALLELRSAVLFQADHSPKPRELVLGMARQWLYANGGSVEVRSDDSGQSELKIFYPLPS